MNNTTTKYIKPVEIYNVDILRGRYRNFSGADKGYGRLDPGKGSFNIRFTEKTTLRVTDDDNRKVEFVGDDVPKYLADEGWNVRIHSPRDEEDEAFYFMSVKFAFRNREGNPVSKAPAMYRVSADRNNEMVRLSERSVANLDEADILSADVKLSANTNFQMFDQTGKASAYLRDGYFICEEDYFNSRYAYKEPDDTEEMPFE